MQEKYLPYLCRVSSSLQADAEHPMRNRKQQPKKRQRKMPLKPTKTTTRRKKAARKPMPKPLPMKLRQKKPLKATPTLPWKRLRHRKIFPLRLYPRLPGPPRKNFWQETGGLWSVSFWMPHGIPFPFSLRMELPIILRFPTAEFPATCILSPLARSPHLPTPVRWTTPPFWLIFLTAASLQVSMWRNMLLPSKLLTR